MGGIKLGYDQVRLDRAHQGIGQLRGELIQVIDATIEAIKLMDVSELQRIRRNLEAKAPKPKK